MIDLPAYLARVGYSGAARTLPPTLATLQLLHGLHTQAIPFENLAPLLGDAVLLDLPALAEKLIRAQRGGYCYEHNQLFQQVLRQLGYTVQGLAARVSWNVPATVQMPRTHMLLLIQLEEGRYIADVGFGGLTLTTPLQLSPDVVQATSHEGFRLLHTGSDAGSDYLLEARLGGEWKSLYHFDLQPQLPADYALASWYVSNHPDSLFVNNLLAARPQPKCRHALLNQRYTVHHLNGRPETRLLHDPQEIKTVLRDVFGIRLPATPALDERLQFLLARAP